MIRWTSLSMVAVSLGALATSRCAPSSSQGTGEVRPSGTVRIFLADTRPSPPGIAALRVTLRGVSVLPAGRDGEIPLDGGPIGVVGEVQIDLAGNRAAPALLASQTIPPGAYRGVRLYVSAASALPVSGAAQALAVAPSRVEVPASLLVDPDATIDVTLDLDVAASIGPPAAPGAAATFRPVVTMMPADARVARP